VSAARDARSPQLRQAHRFEFAVRDMEEVAAAATWLMKRAVPANNERVLLTGLIVSYGRPFTDQGVGAIDGRKFAPRDPDLRQLHERLLYERDRRFAHTDETPGRFIAENVRDLFGMPIELMDIQPGSAVEFVVETLAPTELPAVAALAKGQAERFRVEAKKARAASPEGGKSSGRRLTARGGSPQAQVGNPDGEDNADG
jgi:hypothetical protein